MHCARPAVAAGAAGLLIIPFETFRNVVMDHITHVGLVDPHPERDGRHDYVDLFVQELVLVAGPRRGIHPGMVRSDLDVVGGQQFGQFLDLLAAQAVNDPGLSLVVFDITDNILRGIRLRTDLVEKIRPVERRLEYRSVEHTEVLLNVHLYFRRSRRGQRDQRRLPDLVDDRTNAAVLRAEIVSPFRNTVRLVDRIERYFDFPQEIDVILFGKRFGSEIQQFGFPGQHVLFDLRDGRLVQRRIQKMGDAVHHAERAHRIDLIFHQRDQRRNDDSHAVHHQRGKLITQRFAASGRHQHERIVPIQHVADHRLLISFEIIESEILL